MASGFHAYRNLPLSVHLLCAGTLISRMGAFIGVFMAIYISEELGFGNAFATQCIGLFGLGGICAALLGGHIADLVGRRPVMLIALSGGALILLSIGYIESRWPLIAAMFALSLVSEMFRPAASAMIGDLVESHSRPHAYSLMYIAANLGFAVAPPVGGWLAEAYSFRTLFWADATTTLLFAVIVLRFIPETVQRSRQTRSDRCDAARWTTRDVLRHLKSDYRFLMYCIGTVLISLVFIQSISTLPLYLTSLGLSKADFGSLIGINGILIVLFQLPATQWLNRFQRISVIMVGELLIGVGFGLTALAASKAVILGTIIVWTTGEVLQASCKNALAADLAPEDVRGRYLGVFTMSHAVGISIGPPCGGLILEHLGPQVLWTSCLFVAMLAVALYATAFRQLALPQPETAR